MTRLELNNYVDSQVTNKTTANSLTPTNEGNAIKKVADYVDEQSALKEDKLLYYYGVFNQSGTSAPSGTTKNSTSFTFTWSYSSVGTFILTSSADLSAYLCLLSFTNGQYASTSYTFSKTSSTTFRLRIYDNSTGSPILSNDSMNNSSIKIELIIL